jgi:hypothetical protein
VNAVVAFAQFLRERREADKNNGSEGELSEEEHARILRELDAVVALSVETGPPVSNREHDRIVNLVHKP